MPTRLELVAARAMSARLLLPLLVALFAFWAAPASSQAAPCTPPVTNQVACENTQPGTPESEWDIDGAGDPTIQGYATQMSVNAGETINFKIKSPTTNFKIDILRLGWYGGDGARRVAPNISHTGTATQPACQTFSDSGLIDCGNWSVTGSWAVPSTAVSGVYIAYLKRNDTGGASHITFVVRNDASHSNILLSTSDETWQAYNTYGGNSLYQCTVACPDGDPAAYKAAYKVSYNRPLHVAEDDGGRSALFTGAEYPMIRFLEANGYDVSYTSSLDVNNRGPLLLNHKTFMSSGHDEYWSQQQRTNVEAARDAGVNLAFFTGNEIFWRTRWEPSQAGTTTADRTLVSYKDSHFGSQVDPVSYTGVWADPRFTNAGDAINPSNALTGQLFYINSGTSTITVPQAYGKFRLWKNTAAATLGANSSLTLAPKTLGYEWDVDAADDGFRPAGLVRLSSTTVSGLDAFTDYASTTSGGTSTATHNLTMYKAPSGARVFATGTVQWAWGLDDWNPDFNDPDRNMQQATVNVLADLDAQPGTLASDLTAASKTTDTTAPTSTLSSPPTTVADGAKVTLNGIATDAGGGLVAGVEISTDNGSTWHPATTGTASWSYTWIAHGNPSVKIKTRATDDSGNIETPGAATTVAVTCGCSVWGNNITPDIADSGDGFPIELGMKFKADRFGTINGIRFYKAATNTGTHIGSLWDTSGNRLAQATFNNETASGWQTVTFSTPVSVSAGATYIASYFAPNGHYSATSDYFWRQPAPGPLGGAVTDSGPLHAQKSTGSDGNGVFAYSTSSTYPTDAFGATNYWVDVVYNPSPPPGTATNVAATAAGSTSAHVSWTAPATGGAVTSYTITPYIGTTAQTATAATITGTPPASDVTVTGLTQGTAYTFTVTATNPSGDGPESAKSNAVTPSGATAPSSPDDVGATAGSGSAKVSWSAPTSDGDSAITGYTVIPYIGATAQTTVSAAASARSATISGLANGTTYTFRVTATNAIGTGPASSASPAVTPMATIFDLATPSVPDAGDASGVELGVKFKSDLNGSVAGIRFYKGTGNTGTHIGSLWTTAGTRLAQATFTSESATGWQTVQFASPVTISAGTTYVASYYAPSGHYSVDSTGLGSGFDNVPLHAIANSASANGVYAYGSTSTFPSSSYNATNYYVDVLFSLAAPVAPTAVSASGATQTTVNVSWTAPSTGGGVSTYTVTPYIGTTAQPSKTVTGTPAATSTTVTGLTGNTTYTFKVTASNASGSSPASAASNSITTSSTASAPGAPTGVATQPATSSALVSWTPPTVRSGEPALTGFTITPYIGTTAQTPTTVGGSATSATITGLTNGSSYTFKVAATNSVGTGTQSTASAAVIPRATLFDFATPGTVDVADGSVNLGVKFMSDVGGTVTGVRFYKSAANTGTHIGTLWSSTGTSLASVTFTGETASGWQTMLFSSPVTISAGTTYVVSYLAPNGHYSANGGAFTSSPFDNGQLHALSTLTSPNGVYLYGSANAFPNNTYNATNYWVDVLFAAGS
jgi:hypothetical protein